MLTTHLNSPKQPSSLCGAACSLAGSGHLRRKFDRRRRNCYRFSNCVGRRCVARPCLAELNQRLFDLEVELVELAEQLVVPRFETVQQFAGSGHGGIPAGGQFGRRRTPENVSRSHIAAASIHRLPLVPIAKPIRLPALVPAAGVASCGAITGYVAADPTLAAAWRNDRKGRACCEDFACFAGYASRNG